MNNMTHHEVITYGALITKAINDALNNFSKSIDIGCHRIEMFRHKCGKTLYKNNRRKMNGKPMIRFKAYEKAFRNRRKNYGSSKS